MSAWNKLVGWVNRLFRPGITLGPPYRVQIDIHALYGGIPVRRGQPLIIPSRQDPLWKEKGWQRQGTRYIGYYRAAGQQWPGLIEEPYPGGYQAYIWNPPIRALERTHYRWCFPSNGGGGRHRVHFHHLPTSLDHAITTIEAVLSEALGTKV
jgi:hypothetical protein